MICYSVSNVNWSFTVEGNLQNSSNRPKSVRRGGRPWEVGSFGWWSATAQRWLLCIFDGISSAALFGKIYCLYISLNIELKRNRNVFITIFTKTSTFQTSQTRKGSSIESTIVGYHELIKIPRWQEQSIVWISSVRDYNAKETLRCLPCAGGNIKPSH